MEPIDEIKQDLARAQRRVSWEHEIEKRLDALEGKKGPQTSCLKPGLTYRVVDGELFEVVDSALPKPEPEQCPRCDTGGQNPDGSWIGGPCHCKQPEPDEEEIIALLDEHFGSDPLPSRDGPKWALAKLVVQERKRAEEILEENSRILSRIEYGEWASGHCSRHQVPDPMCRICNRKIGLVLDQLDEARVEIETLKKKLKGYKTGWKDKEIKRLEKLLKDKDNE